MIFPIKTDVPQKLKTACLILAVPTSGKLTPVAAAIDKSTHGLVARTVASGDLKGEPGKTALLHTPRGMQCDRLLLVAWDRPKPGVALSKYRSLCAGVAHTLKSLGVKEAALVFAGLAVQEADAHAKARHFVEAVEDALYSFTELKTKNTEVSALKKVALLVADADTGQAVRSGVREGAAISAGKHLAKALGNLPGNVCTPSYLAAQAQQLAKDYALKSTILDQKDMEKLKMGALLSVSRGSRQPPKLIVVEYQGGAKGDPPIALVGKGLTFDAGGISIKPAQAMDEMKFDMCGGASVLGALKAIAELKLPVNVVGVIPSSENLPDGNANKPGDVVTSMSGQTIEVLNTDAEGRLILCDALTYTERFNPAVVIDIATLTGACVVALGQHASGLMTNDDELAEELLAAGSESLDRAWRLPLWEDYDSQLDSNFADMANIGGRYAGAITAACFLARYTEKFTWAHLDIAGTAWVSEGKNKGATGRVVPLVTQFAINRAKSV
ncbi:MAG: leucyl aminopeptidase [Gammaproteobacteria bacterium]|nr:leucyl aminopeptidase [Gammaproteobacteria bacterium]